MLTMEQKKKSNIIAARARAKNRLKIRVRDKEVYQKNKQKILARKKQYYECNKQKICEQHKKRRLSDRTGVLETEKKQRQYKYHNNKQFRLACTIRSRFRSEVKKALQKNKTLHRIKQIPLEELLGCCTDDFFLHLEKQFKPGMSWENWTLRGWHVDHIIPCSSFDLSDPTQLKQCFNYANLQPMWAIDNWKKGAKHVKQQ